MTSASSSTGRGEPVPNKHIDEIDVAPKAYMMFNDGQVTAYFLHRVLCWSYASEDAARAGYEGFMQEVHDLLPDGGVILWRQRVLFEHHKKRHVFYCRFATSPPLPAEWWTKNGRPEGLPVREAV